MTRIYIFEKFNSIVVAFSKLRWFLLRLFVLKLGPLTIHLVNWITLNLQRHYYWLSAWAIFHLWVWHCYTSCWPSGLWSLFQLNFHHNYILILNWKRNKLLNTLLKANKTSLHFWLLARSCFIAIWICLL